RPPRGGKPSAPGRARRPCRAPGRRRIARGTAEPQAPPRSLRSRTWGGKRRPAAPHAGGAGPSAPPRRLPALQPRHAGLPARRRREALARLRHERAYSPRVAAGRGERPRQREARLAHVHGGLRARLALRQGALEERPGGGGVPELELAAAEV